MNTSEAKKLISIVGPTGIGKTRMGIEIARFFDTEVISADSRQYYREMEIGTAKPNKEELKTVKHHFINSLSIHDEYTAGSFERDSLILLEQLFSKYDVVVMVGGSGLYCKAVWEGLDEMPKIREHFREDLNRQFEESGLQPLLDELKEKDPVYYELVDRKNHQRVIRALEVIRGTGKAFSSYRRGSRNQTERGFQNIKIGLEDDRDKIYSRIDKRMDQMISWGLFEETERLKSFQHLNALKTVGYSEIFPYLAGEYDFDEAVRLLKRNSRRYAKRQLTWFKKDEEITWFLPEEFDKVIDYIQKVLDT